MSVPKSWSGWWKRARGKRAGLSLAHAARSAAQRPARWQPFEPLENRRMLSFTTNGSWELIPPRGYEHPHPPAASIPGDNPAIEKVSVGFDGVAGNGDSYSPVLNADGRYIAFESDASNLVPGDTNNNRDIFVYDRVTQQIERASVASDGSQANGGSYGCDISADGRYIAFASNASNLVPGDTNNRSDIFVYDRATQQIERVSVAPDGSQANGRSYACDISADGRYIAFCSDARNLVSDDTFYISGGFFVYDRLTQQTQQVNAAFDGSQANGTSYAYGISAGGRYVTFTSWADNLVPNDTNGHLDDVFVHDCLTGQTQLVSVATDGTQGNGYSESPAISADGRHVSFTSDATNLVPGITVTGRNIYVHDLDTGETSWVGQADYVDDTPASYLSALNADGSKIVFESVVNNLVPGDTNNWYDVFLYDRATGQTQRASLDTVGLQRQARYLSISDDGRYVGFALGQVFDSQSGRTLDITSAIYGADDEREALNVIISPDGNWISFDMDDPPMPDGPAGTPLQFLIPRPHHVYVVPNPFLQAPPELVSVTGDGHAIPNNDATPSSADGTDFGAWDQDIGRPVHAFEMHSSGDFVLEISDITISGPAADDFQVVYYYDGTYSVVDGYYSYHGRGGDVVDYYQNYDHPPDYTPQFYVSADVPGSFNLRFNPTALGLRKATVEIHTNDPAHPVYSFNVAGTGIVGIPQLTVSGNGRMIAAGDSSPSNDDFTDFGVASTNHDFLHRVYVVRNTGDGRLNINSISLGGSDADDFYLYTYGISDYLDPGESGYFRVDFIPHAAGLSRATLHIVTDDPAQSSFEFAIRGAGVNARFLGYSIDPWDDLRTYTKTSGTGLAATWGSRLVVDYKEYLTDGTVTHQSTEPVWLVLGAQMAVPGVELGLQGVKEGETRLLFVPPALGYGSQAVGAIPANSTVMYEVTVHHIDFPQAQVLGNGAAIAPNDKTPSLTDGTDFGSVSMRGTATQVFTLADPGLAEIFLNGANAVHFSGSAAGDFTVGAIAREQDGTISIPITFTPSAVGKRSTTVTIDTTDPGHATYSFTVMGVGAAPQVVITALDDSAAETRDGDPADLGVFRISAAAGPTDRDLNVFFKVSGSAKLGDEPKGDYRLEVDGTLLPLGTKYVTLPAGEDYVDVTVVPVDDNLVEKLETVQMTLQAAKTYRLSSAPAGRQAVVAITDNEPTLWLDLPDATGQEGGDDIEFQVHRDGNANVSVTFNFALSGSAKAGVDYTIEINGTTVDANTKQWTLAGGQTSATIRLIPVADGKTEKTEFAYLELRNGKTYSLSTNPAQRKARAEILDAPLVLSFQFLDLHLVQFNNSLIDQMLQISVNPPDYSPAPAIVNDPPVVEVGAVSLPAEETTGYVVYFGSSFVTDLDVHFLVAADDSASSTDSQV